MEFNQLPDGFEGEQKRQTKFDSTAAKLAFDAKNLVTKARESLKETGIDNASSDQVVAAIKLIVGSHRKDFNKALPDTEQTLEGAITSNLYTEEEQAKFAQVKSREGVRSQYEAFIDDAKLPESDALKLKEMMSEANYRNAVETAEEMKASKIPTYEQITAELMTYTPERLRDICAEMEKPKLQIISDQSFDDNIAAMNDNKHYTAADCQPQKDAFAYKGSDSPYNKLVKPGKVKAKIIDGVIHPKQLEGVSTRLGERRTHLIKKFEAKKMRLADHAEMQTLIQQSLREANATGDNSLIVDNWEKWAKENIPGTITILDPNTLTKSTLVAWSDFCSDLRQALFDANYPGDGAGHARGRASVQVLEI